MAFLVEISNALASSIDYNTTLATVSRLTVPKLADSCIVDLLDEHGNLERVAVGHVDPTRANLLLEMSRRFPSYGIKSSLHTTVVQQRRTIIIPQVQQELVEAYVQSEEHRQMVEAIGPHRSLVVVPIMARDRLLGAFSFEMGLSNRSFSKADLPMLEEVTHRVAVAIDNARLYQEAQHALATQQELDNLKDLFLSVTTHELRNPLTSISGYAQMLQRQVLKQVANTSDEQPDWNKFSRPVQAIIDQGNRLNEMINQLLDFSRIQNGKLEIQPVSGLNLLQLAERVVEQQQLTTSDHSLLLKAPSGPVLATYDAARLEQVLDNLISNAFKYSLPGTTVIVGVESFSASGEAVLWVKDDGYGIEPEQQAHIFDRFYRIRNDETTRIEGLGLGLYITREIIKAHNGRIWLVSEAEKGSTFYIALPASQNEI